MRRKLLLIFGLLGAANVLIWLAATITFQHFALVLGTATLAYTFGLRHALDADHISAIDNVTRKLVQDGRRPLLVGFWFSLGHSTVVILLSIGIAATASRLQSHFPDLQRVGGLIGTSISAAFLLGIAAVNLLILRSVVRAFARIKRGEPYHRNDLDSTLTLTGPMGRVFRPMLRLVDRGWKMYGLGFLFGLGFDTATEVGVLGISAAAATQGMPIWSILLLPALFTAGMCLVDTADGVLMLGAYGWAYIHPVRKLYYNMTITAISVAIAVLVGGVEILNVIGEQFDMHGPFWRDIAAIGDHFGLTGVIIIAIFVATWMASLIGYRALGYHELELAGGDTAA
ncbi:MAG TPA: HoxN/HupN/NixA family nickel/cobalt transporter [Tepidisphaeraceae bacterium]|nr:HoxN/HupN/NixA family nickel/cobalt transporter [Tepidisphaeraceae bacterium]